jgi:putative intracellular protease/amidase
VARILAALLPDETKVVASLCHGPAAFLAAGDAEGNWLFKGRKLTAFTDEEEKQAGLADSAPWLLEDRLRAGGAIFESAPAWSSHVVVDGNLITAQNPASAEAAGQAILAKLV